MFRSPSTPGAKSSGPFPQALRIFILLAALAFRPASAQGQKLEVRNPPAGTFQPSTKIPVPPYVRPTLREKFDDYLKTSYGPLSVLESGFNAGILQAQDSPPEWHQGATAYGKRFGSDYASTAISHTAKLTFGALLGEDTKYYPCECKGIFHRAGHALLSAFTARRGADGHRVLSVPTLVAPYAASMARLAWYPDRYGPMDAFRSGNYSLLNGFEDRLIREFLRPLVHWPHRAKRAKPPRS